MPSSNGSALHHKASLYTGITPFIGQDPKIREILDLVDQVADTDATVLISGETGTGKELVAQMLHAKSSRCYAPFLSLNCGAIPESLEDSELFGHARGAFTGATERKLGLFEAVDGGTCFLDEISELSRTGQVRLLRILQSGEYRPVGGVENRYCNVRIVAATNQDLQSLVNDGGFRSDLFYRLNIIRLELPPLRDRRDDIPLMVEYYTSKFCTTYHKPDLQISDEANEILTAYAYPGNIRELENIIRRGVLLCGDSSITIHHLPSEVLNGKDQLSDLHDTPFHEAKEQTVNAFEKNYLSSMLQACGGIVARAAQQSGLSERNFHGKLKKYGIDGMSFRR